MKMVQYIIGFKCPYCSEVYKDFEDAEDCATECANIQEPIEAQQFVCDICNESYVSESDAIVCEQEHEAKNDLVWRQYEVKKNFEVLKKAASVPGQLRIGDDPEIERNRIRELIK